MTDTNFATTEVTTDDLRFIQAGNLSRLGVSKALGFADFESYLVTIPEVGKWLLAEDKEFPYLVLVDPRIGLEELCDFANIKMKIRERYLDARSRWHHDLTAPTWIRVQDGRKNHCKSAHTCCLEFKAYERGLTAFQGVNAVVQHPTIVADIDGNEGSAHAMELPGSIVHMYGPRKAATFICRNKGLLELDCDHGGGVNGKFGSASRRFRRQQQ